MSTHKTEDIRNIALVGHFGSGKTTLAEALLCKAGVIPAMGSVEKGTTVCDTDPEEKEFQHSLAAAVVSLEHEGKHINLIDTPGLPGFLGRTYSVLPAVETVAMVINAETGIETMTRRLMAWSADEHFCRVIVINKMDTGTGNLAGLVEELQASFGKECIPINLPSKDGTGVVDCFFSTPEEAAFSSPADVHAALVEQVVELDEDLMNVYLEDGDIEPEKLHDVFEQALREGHLIPICFVSATTGAGVPDLMDFIAKLAPNPREGNPHPFGRQQDEDQPPIPIEPDPGKHVIAHVFKIIHDPFMGKMGVFRIHQGTITKETQIFVNDGKKSVRAAHLLRMQSSEHKEVEKGVPGDICALAKIDDVHLNAILHSSHGEDYVRLSAGNLPPPVEGLAIENKVVGEEQKLVDGLSKLTAEDPCLVVEREPGTGEQVLRGLGEFHLRIALTRLSKRYNVEVETRQPKIAYRETITAEAEGHHRHKKQSGGSGQFGEVYLRVAPVERGDGFAFENKVVGGSIPSQFIPAVEKGVKQAIDGGGIAGYPVHDVAVQVYDGKHHEVDSQEASFIMAGKRAFVDALKKAKPIILEPIVTLDVTVPSTMMGDIIGDISGRRGRVQDTETHSDGTVVVTGLVPMGELADFPVRLKSMTAGEGSYSLSFSHYDPVPPHIQQELVRAYKPVEEA